MATTYSTQYANLIASIYTPNHATDSGGVVTRKYFSYTTTANDDSGGKTYLQKIPANCRLYGGYIQWADAGASAQTLDIGIEGADDSGFYNAAGTLADDDDFFTTATAIAAATAGASAFGMLLTDAGAMYLTDKEVRVVAYWKTADPDTGTLIEGYIEYQKV